MDKNRFVPEDKGRLVTAFLEEFFERYVEYDFTADLERKLDLVSAGEMNWKDLLREFWQGFQVAVSDIAELRTTQVLDALNDALGPHIFPDKGDGRSPRCPTRYGALSLRPAASGPHRFSNIRGSFNGRWPRRAEGSEGAAIGSGLDPASGLVRVPESPLRPLWAAGEGESPRARACQGLERGHRPGGRAAARPAREVGRTGTASHVAGLGR